MKIRQLKKAVKSGDQGLCYKYREPYHLKHIFVSIIEEGLKYTSKKIKLIKTYDPDKISILRS